MGVKGLLDTHTVLWALFSPGKLGKKARSVLEHENAVLYTSPVSFFEMAQKVRVGKLPLEEGLLRDLPGVCRSQGWLYLELDVNAAIQAGLFPAEHRDPFDRLLAAQALSAGLPLLSKDRAMDAFQVQRLW